MKVYTELLKQQIECLEELSDDLPADQRELVDGVLNLLYAIYQTPTFHA